MPRILGNVTPSERRILCRTWPLPDYRTGILSISYFACHSSLPSVKAERKLNVRINREGALQAFYTTGRRTCQQSIEDVVPPDIQAPTTRSEVELISILNLRQLLKCGFKTKRFWNALIFQKHLFMRYFDTRIKVFLERVDCTGQAIYILHVEARNTWRWTSI